MFRHTMLLAAASAMAHQHSKTTKRTRTPDKLEQAWHAPVQANAPMPGQDAAQRITAAARQEI